MRKQWLLNMETLLSSSTPRPIRACIKDDYEEVGFKNGDLHTSFLSIRIPKTQQPLINLQFTLVLMWKVLKCLSSHWCCAETSMDDAILILDKSSWGPCWGGLDIFFWCAADERYDICLITGPSLCTQGLAPKDSDIFSYVMTHVGLGQSEQSTFRYLCSAWVM